MTYKWAPRKCRIWALENECLTDYNPGSRGFSVHCLVQDIMKRVIARAQESAALVIKRAWLKQYYDPRRSLCVRRLMREYKLLTDNPAR